MSEKYIVERSSNPDTKGSWYEVMLSPFNTVEECLEYIKKYSIYYPIDHRNYRIVYQK